LKLLLPNNNTAMIRLACCLLAIRLKKEEFSYNVVSTLFAFFIGTFEMRVLVMTLVLKRPKIAVAGFGKQPSKK
jgi:hypothetical protein